LLPSSALADGPVSPTGTDFYAKVTHAPAGVRAEVVDEYLNLWVSVAPDAHVTVLDFRGAPWVRFNPSGVSINEHSQEYYLSQVPLPAVPPAGLTRLTPPHWVRVSTGHSFQWREGRIHALANVALAPGQSFIGDWRIAVLVDGRLATITGDIWHHGPPSALWFWPAAVLIGCALAAWRVRSAVLDRRLSRALALILLALASVGIASKYLHGSPGVSVGGVTLLLITVSIFGAVARALVRAQSGWLLLVAAAFSSWVGVTLLPVLTHGYALVTLPAFPIRAITTTLLGGGLTLVPFALRLLDAERS
jgi:hypothetical protein